MWRSRAFARAADVRMLHVPFKDAGTLFAAVASGEVDFTAFGMNSVAGLMAAGRMRPLAVAAARRLPSHPRSRRCARPAARRSTCTRGPRWSPWPAPRRPVLEQLQRDIVAALGSAEVLQRAEQAGFEITPSTPQALRERIAADSALYAPLVSEGRVARL